MFPFNQPPKTRDCGYRCLYYIIQPNNVTYPEWLDQFKLFDPVQSGITFTDICTVLKQSNISFSFSQLKKKGLYLIYSGVWLKPDNLNHGHYFIYENGTILCSTKAEPYYLSFAEVEQRLEAKTVEGAFRCLKVVK